MDVDKELPNAPIVLTPLRKHQPSPFFSTSHCSREPRLSFTQQSSHARLRWIYTLPALAIALLVFILATILLLYLAAFRRVPAFGDSDSESESAVFVSERPVGKLLGLTITTVSTHIVAISVPLLISVAAYCVAEKWLAEQEFPRQTRAALPTPLQYGFMVKMLATSSIVSVYQAGRYARASKGVVRIPRAFHLALAMSSIILGHSCALILADIWLHAASSIVQGTVTTAVRNVSFGVAFNESACTGSHACLSNTGVWAATQPWIIHTGLLVAANAATSFSVITLNNTPGPDPTVVIPQSVDSSMLFDAPSFGVSSQCANLTPNCTVTTTGGALPTQCRDGAKVLLSRGGNTSTSTTHSAPGAANTAAFVQTGATLFPTTSADANPQHVVLQLQWSANASGTVRTANPTAFQTRSGDILAWASCDLTFYNLTLRHQAGSYSVLGAPTLADPSFARIMQGGLLSQLGNLHLLSNLQFVSLQLVQATMLTAPNETAALAATNQALGHLALALFAGTLQLTSSPASTIRQAVLGRYPLAPVIVYLLLLYAYALTAVAVYVWATYLRMPLIRGANTVQLAQLRLTDPLALVAALYPSPGQRAAAEDPRELFLEDEDTPRLEVGMHGEVNGPSVIRVHRRRAARSAFEVD
ncbi:hypothetical protein GGX14DRAFT_541754 [Mycena pura]|uniref:Uncharacterized protein n=1 Tax=Mycena pura TaxID=153505 RepID=A0AAD6VNM7_9AGAR|nr:hypothetical protein GGX14DRAFT_541754 [Mycena pura]